MPNIIFTEEQYEAILKLIAELERREQEAQAKAKEKKAA